ncbi:hypothetical protein [Chthonobacter albigriseus]|uniref:hypothetical protein n=1 Tax=Chthonobacter albigriseus TaxID=1683161 RepID=UPI0015EF7E1F|nr:hypothetical protein [Chthonobacter albigriseus]
MTLSRPVLIGLVVVIAAIAVILAFQLGEERADNGTIELNVGENGVRLDTK